MNKVDVRLETPEFKVDLSQDSIVKVDFQGGLPGKGAYELWIEEGNVGTIQDFLNSLRGAGAETFIHEQIRASNTWEIRHYLNKYPAITIVDSGNNVVIGEVQYIDNDRLTVSFNFEFSGIAYLN